MTIFSRLFRMFLFVVFVPLIPVSMLVFYYQGYAKNNILETHDNLAKMAASATQQHIDNITWRLIFADSLEAALKNKKNVERELDSALAVNPDFIMLAVLDKDGKELYKAGPKNILDRLGYIDLSQDTSLEDIRHAGKLNLSSFDVHLGLPISEMLYPLKDGNFLFGVVSFYKFWGRLESQTIGGTGRIYLVAESGDIFISDRKPEQIISQYYLNSAILSGQHLQKDLKGYNKIKYIGAIEPLPINDAYVAVLQQKNEAYASLDAITAFLIFFILAIAVLSYFAAYSFAGSIANPIASLIAGAKRISKGSLETPVEKDDDWREFNGLIDSFNSMMASLKDYRDLQIKQQVSEMKEFVFKAVAHDLRAPVLGMQGYVDLLASGKFSKEEEKEYIDTLKLSVNNLSGMLEDILDASKLEAGMLRPDKKLFDAKAMFTKTADLLRPTAEKKNITITLNLLSDKQILGDETQLSRVVTNLLSNSIKFMDKGAIMLTYKTDDKNAYVEVVDAGPGIKEAELEAIFDKYHKTTDSEIKGYGLGLTISRQIVNAHGGAIKAANAAAGKGAVISFTLPLK
ncbi:signal transduction histidine kinase [Elusimicrobium simillimum]|uniref:sensor histidine kinase n=1 Tax=Elusimicrobium simillimum TaxID=3143438 RepID=UPI003C6F5319